MSLNITLSGPEYVKAGDEIWVNCLSNVTPYGQIAEFLVNGITFKTLRKKPTGCYSAISNNNCLWSTCRCLADGKEFAIKIKEPLPNTVLNITCSMKFKLNTTTFSANDDISIHVLGKYMYELSGYYIL